MPKNYGLKLINLKRCFLEGNNKNNLFNEQYANRMNDFALSERATKEIEFLIKKILPTENSKVLDFGCNTGVTMNHIWERCRSKMYGVDINEYGINEGKNKYPSFNFKIINSHLLPYKNNFFDWVMVNHVIAHVPNPSLTLKEIYRVLKANGKVSIVTPNRWYAIFMTPNNIINNYKPDPTILRYYTFKSLNKLLKECGFDDIDQTFFGEMPSCLNFLSVNFCKMRLIAIAKKGDIKNEN